MKPVAVEIQGAKAEITHIYAVPGTIHEPEDKLMVLIKFPAPVVTGGYGISAIGAHIPAKVYGRQEFLDAVVHEGGKELTAVIRQEAQRAEDEERRVDKKAEMEGIITEIESALEL